MRRTSVVVVGLMVGCGFGGSASSGGGSVTPPVTQLQLTIVSGNNQAGAPGKALAPLVVALQDGAGKRIAGATVTFAITQGSGGLSTTASATDAQGQASTVLTPGSGMNSVTASAAQTSPVVFTAVGTGGGGGPTTLTYVNDIAPILKTQCVSCHAPGGAMASSPLTTYSEVRSGTTKLNATPGAYIVPGSPSQSLLVAKTSGAGSMSVHLNSVQAQELSDWVLQGAIESPVPLPSQIQIVSGNGQSAVAGSALASPLVVAVKDTSGGAVSGFSVTFTLASGGGTLSAATASTDASGQASVTLTLGKSAGTNTVTASGGGLSPVTFTATGVAGPAAQISIVSGNNQTGVAGSALSKPLVVVVTDANGNPVSGAPVAFAVTTGAGTLSAKNVATDTLGGASTTLTLDKAAGPNAASATVSGLTPVAFAATGTSGAASVLAIVSGNNQTGVAGSALSKPLVVVVKDANGNPVAGAPVAFAVTTGAGTLSAKNVATDANGNAATALTLDKAAGPNAVSATVSGLTPVAFAATGTAGPASQLAIVSGNAQSGVAGAALANALVVSAKDANQNPVSGLQITFAVTAGGGSLSATTGSTDASGLASTRLTLGATPGTNTVSAAAAGVAAVTFTETGLAAGGGTIALSSGDAQTGVAGSALGNPLVVIVKDASQVPVAGTSVSFSVVSGGGSLSASSAVTNAQGLASVTLTLGKQAGPNQVAATSTGLAGSPVTFTTNGAAGPASQIAIASGDAQSGVAGSALAAPLAVTVQDANGNPIAGFTVGFTAASGGGSVSPASMATNAAGRAQTSLTLGTTAGSNTVTAAGSGLAAVGFTETGTPGAATQLAIVSGNGQSGVAGSALAAPFVVRVSDANGNGVPVLAVAFAVTAGGGSLSATNVATDAQGRAQATLTLGTVAGNNTVTASGNGLGGSPAAFSATGTPGSAAQLVLGGGGNQSGLAGTALPNPLVVIVKDGNGNAVQGVVVAFSTMGGTLSAASATSDAQGRAQTTLAPALGTNTVTASSGALGPVTFTETGTAPLTFTADVLPILQQNCIICHGPGGVMAGSPLTTYTEVRSGTTRLGYSPAAYVTPNDPTQSLICAKTDATSNPPGSMSNKLTAAQAQTIRAWVAGGAPSGAGAPTQVLLASGNNQTGQSGTALPVPFVVTVADASANPVSGVLVAFAVTAGGGTLSASSAQTDAQGHAQTTLTLGAVGANTATASATGLTGSPIVFSATATASTYSGEPLASSTNPIDQAALIALKAQGVEPAPLSGDDEFIRRVTSDVVGRIPTVAELLAFRADTATNKRATLIDDLLASPEYANHWTKEVLGPWICVPATDKDQNTNVVYNFDATLQPMIASDTPLSSIVQQLVSGTNDIGMEFRYKMFDGANHFYAPDQLMLTFGGTTSKCTRCHDHPKTVPGKDDPVWKQVENWGLYAFFTQSDYEDTIRDKAGNAVLDALGNPILAEPAWFADGYASAITTGLPKHTDPVATRWAKFGQLFSSSQRFYRGTAHRIWAEIDGPLLDPNQFLQSNLDAMKQPAVLAALTKAFSDNGTQLRAFLRVCLNSKLYQLARSGTTTQNDALLARHETRRQNAEVLLRGVLSVQGVAFNPDPATNDGYRQLVNLGMLGFPGRETITDRNNAVNVGQSLFFLNGTFDGYTPFVPIQTLASQVDSNAITLASAITTIVRTILSRDPTPSELTTLLAVRSNAAYTATASYAFLQDLSVSLLSSVEFQLH